MSFSEKTDETTIDAVFDGAIMIRQSRRGYRFNTDSLLLADQVARSRPSSVVDLGAGSGVISLALAHRLPDVAITAIERQPRLLEHLRHNVADHPRVRVITGDARVVEPDRKVEVVVMNPPYYRPNSGRIPPNKEKADARHQRHGGVAELLEAAFRWVAPDGSVHLTYPTARRGEPIAALRESEFGCVFERPIISAVSNRSKVVLFTARRGPYNVTILPPLLVYADSSTYTQEASSAFAGSITAGLRRR
ncbi:MAG: tRNA1Val (adenine37-N6)-methyltransferase [Bradymonadia bacterium]